MVDPFACVPDYEFDTTEEAFEFLLERSDSDIEGVLVDLDGVLMEVDGSHPDPAVGTNVRPEIVELLTAIDDHFGTCIVTNRVRYDDFDPTVIEAVFDVPVVSDAKKKPSREIFEAGLAILDIDPDRSERVVMVGDSSYYDTYGAGRVGLQTIQIDQDRRQYAPPQMVGKYMADMVQTVFKTADSVRRRSD